MKHGVAKKKFKGGYDANKMLRRKLVRNFLEIGWLETTLAKAKAIRPFLDKMAERTKERSEANKNHLLKLLADMPLVEKAFGEVGPVIKDIKGGYVRIIKLGQRMNDGSLMARLEWAYPVVKEKKITAKAEKKPEEINK